LFAQNGLSAQVGLPLLADGGGCMLRHGWIVLSIVMSAVQFGCGGGRSSSGVAVITTQSTAVTISSVSPSSATAGSPDLQLSVTGANFDAGARRVNQIVWSANGVATRIPATFNSTTRLTVILPAVLLKAPVAANLTVEIWDVTGDAPLATSNTVKFSVTNPAITISPTTATAGSSDLVLNIAAGTFVFSDRPHKFNQAVWYANGERTLLNTTFVSTTQLTATVRANLLATGITAKIAVEIWDVQGDVPDAVSPTVNFTVTSGSPWDY
jgi:hypothetical protein